MTKFNELPENVKAEILDTLKAYDEVFVVYEYGKFHVSVGVMLKAEYAPDHKVIGTFYARDLYTEKERMINYIESFHDFPSNYKGKRNYRMLRDIEGDWNAKFAFDDNGDLYVM